MAKTSGTTRSGSSSNPRGVGGRSTYAKGSTFRNFDYTRDALAADNLTINMRNSLRDFADGHGYNGVSTSGISGEGTGNVRNYSISVENERNGNDIHIYYETRITGNVSPRYGSPDFDRYQEAIRNVGKYDTVEQADRALKEQIRRIDRMNIR